MLLVPCVLDGCQKLKSHQRKVRQAQQAWNVPSVGASLNRINGLQSSWGHLLTDLWVLTMSRQPHIQMPQECQGCMHLLKLLY